MVVRTWGSTRHDTGATWVRPVGRPYPCPSPRFSSVREPSGTPGGTPIENDVRRATATAGVIAAAATGAATAMTPGSGSYVVTATPPRSVAHFSAGSLSPDVRHQRSRAGHWSPRGEYRPLSVERQVSAGSGDRGTEPVCRKVVGTRGERAGTPRRGGSSTARCHMRHLVVVVCYRSPTPTGVWHRSVEDQGER